MKYKTFRNGVVVTGLLLVGGGIWAFSRGGGEHAQQPAAREVAEPVRAAEPPAGDSPGPTAAEPLAAADHVSYLRRMLGRPASSDKLKDALGPRLAKVNVYNEGGRWARAKVDLDRDERWDEKWWVAESQVWRAVSPGDDEHYGDKQLVGPIE